ncbi:hypothetical protein KAJ27_24340 [bacterium]|nr:hypothetical protein [bacterium]
MKKIKIFVQLFISLLCCQVLFSQGLMVLEVEKQSNPGRNIALEFLSSYKVPFKTTVLSDVKKYDAGIVFSFNENIDQDSLDILTDFVSRGGMLIINGGCFKVGKKRKVSIISEAFSEKNYFLNKPLAGSDSVVNPYHYIADLFDTALGKFAWIPVLYGHEYCGDRKISYDPGFGKKYIYYGLANYGKGKILYIASRFPLLGYGASNTLEEFIVLRKIILDYFSENNLFLYRITPWPAPYKTAVYVRHDFDRSMTEKRLDWVYKLINDYQKEEENFGVTGNYFIRTERFEEDGGKLLSLLVDLSEKNKIKVLSHSRSHRRYDLNPEQERADIEKSFDMIKENFLDRGIAFVFPYYNGVSQSAHEFMAEVDIKVLGELTIGLPYPFYTVNIFDREFRKYKHIQLPVNVCKTEKFVELEFSNILETLSHFIEYPDLQRLMIERVVSFGGLINSYTHFREGNEKAYKNLFKILKGIPSVWKPLNKELYDWWSRRDKLELIEKDGQVSIKNNNNSEVSFTLIRENNSGSIEIPLTLTSGETYTPINE